ncbi:AMT1-3, partial [Symbiodinium sp. KB8]
MKVCLAAALAAAFAATAMSQDSPAELLRELQAQKALLEEQRKELKQMTETQESMAGAMDSAWLVLCGALVMFMHAGFAMLETGCCRAKNASNVLMKNLVNVSVGTLGWWMFGWALAYGSQAGSFIGTDGFFGATIVSGCVAERVKSPTYAFFAFCMTSFIYPVVVAWTWGGGWLASIFDVGYMDFAGSGVVHFTGGVCGLAGTIILGPRRGRFENPEEFEYHNVPLVVLGTFALWFGWYGFNPGSTLSMHDKEMGALAAQVAMNTTLSAATCGITVFLLKFVLVRKYDVGALCNGILSGLVSITAGCGNMECGSAVLTGFIGAFFYQAASSLLVRLKIDDPVDASAVHGACGVWGLLAAGLFDWGKGFDHYHGWSGFGCMAGDDGACRSGLGGAAIGAQIVMILAIIAWAGTLSTLSFLVLKFSGLLRIGENIEKVGYDMHSHSPPKAYAFSGEAVKPIGVIPTREPMGVILSREGQGRISVRNFVFELRARGPKARAKVDNFIDTAFEFYKQKKGEEIDKSRYLYQPVLNIPKSSEEAGSDDDGDMARKYKRYLLSDSKSFDTLFFPEKKQLLKLVDDSP